MQPEQKGFFKETQHLVEEYINERLLLLKYQTAERTAGILSALLLGLCFGLLFTFLLLLISALAVYFFASLTQSWYAGFFIIIGFYALVFLGIYTNKKRLCKYFSDLTVSLFFSDTHDLNDGESNK